MTTPYVRTIRRRERVFLVRVGLLGALAVLAAVMAVVAVMS